MSREHSNLTPLKEEKTNPGDLTFEKSAGPLTSAVSRMRNVAAELNGPALPCLSATARTRIECSPSGSVKLWTPLPHAVAAASSTEHRNPPVTGSLAVQVRVTVRSTTLEYTTAGVAVMSGPFVSVNTARTVNAKNPVPPGTAMMHWLAATAGQPTQVVVECPAGAVGVAVRIITSKPTNGAQLVVATPLAWVPTQAPLPTRVPDPETDGVTWMMPAEAGAASTSARSAPSKAAGTARRDIRRLGAATKFHMFPLLPDISATPTLARACAERYPQFVQFSAGDGL